MPRSLPLAFLLCACAGSSTTDVEPRDAVDDRIRTHVAQLFTAHDADRDGNLSREEADDHPWLAGEFERADLDGDGSLTQDEAAQFASDEHDAHCEDDECSSAESLDEHVARVHADLDADHDAAVTRAEAEGHHLEHVFAIVDSNDDERVSEDELRSFAQRMHGDDEHPEARRHH